MSIARSIARSIDRKKDRKKDRRKGQEERGTPKCCLSEWPREISLLAPIAISWRNNSSELE